MLMDQEKYRSEASGLSKDGVVKILTTDAGRIKELWWLTQAVNAFHLISKRNGSSSSHGKSPPQKKIKETCTLKKS